MSDYANGGTEAKPIETAIQADGHHRQVVTIGDVGATLELLLGALASLPLAVDPSTGRLRVVLDATGGAQTLGTITTVATVTTLANMAQVGGVAANSAVLDQMTAAWAGALRGRIT